MKKFEIRFWPGPDGGIDGGEIISIKETKMNDPKVCWSSEHTRIVIVDANPERETLVRTVLESKGIDALGKPSWHPTSPHAGNLALELANELVDALGTRPEWDKRSEEEIHYYYNY